MNCIVLATIYAVHRGITKDSAFNMPAMTLFGKYFLWALKDTVKGKLDAYQVKLISVLCSLTRLTSSCKVNGNYDEIYERNFGETEDRGRNALNNLETPQFFNNPGLVASIFP